jgi:hypothetical protein
LLSSIFAADTFGITSSVLNMSTASMDLKQRN